MVHKPRYRAFAGGINDRVLIDAEQIRAMKCPCELGPFSTSPPQVKVPANIDGGIPSLPLIGHRLPDGFAHVLDDDIILVYWLYEEENRGRQER
jgi:hypothetical protein